MSAGLGDTTTGGSKDGTGLGVGAGLAATEDAEAQTDPLSALLAQAALI
jgi:hypothetical protein